MKKVILALALCLLLTGCSWMDGNHVSITPHTPPNVPQQPGNITVSDYDQIKNALEDMVESGAKNGVLSSAELEAQVLETNLDWAIQYIIQSNPIAAYAVESITYDSGTSGGLTAAALDITYRHGTEEIRRIKQAQSMDEAKDLIYTALDQCGTGVVMKVSGYTQTDFAQIVENYANAHPESVMELPQVTEKIYPDSGSVRVVELQFTYQTGRDSLKSMQSYVQPVFSAARLYVTGDTEDSVKYSQLFSFLMERYDYQLDTSITPAYSLLRHGVGDSKAFALVYASMCRNADLECLVVSGTREAEPRFWNMICVDGVYYHVDLLQSSRADGLRMLTDDEMQGYVWDYSAYPAAVVPEKEGTQE